MRLEFHVVDCGDEEEAQAETAAAISVAVSDNLEAFGPRKLKIHGHIREVCGWETWIRTKIDGVRVASPGP
jgi:hypothetical protein